MATCISEGMHKIHMVGNWMAKWKNSKVIGFVPEQNFFRLMRVFIKSLWVGDAFCDSNCVEFSINIFFFHFLFRYVKKKNISIRLGWNFNPFTSWWCFTTNSETRDTSRFCLKGECFLYHCCLLWYDLVESLSVLVCKTHLL